MKKIALITFAIAYTFFFGEAFVRIFHPVALMPRYVTAAPYGVRMNIPNAQYWQTTPETRVHLRNNAQGIRADKEYSYQKAKNQCRLLLLGDSYFVGYEVDIKDSFAYLLEQKLQQANYPCEVINLAVSGFGTAEMLVTLEHEGLKYQPDIVIFQWHSTDWDDNVRSELFKVNATNQLIRTQATYLPAIKISDWLNQFAIYRWLIENSQFYSAIRETIANNIKEILVSLRQHKEKSATELPKANSPTPPTGKKSYAQRLSEQLLLAAQQMSHSHQAQFGVLEIPDRRSRTTFKSNLSKFEPQLREQLNMWTPLAVFEQAAHPNKKIYFEKGHFHLTPLGNQLVTEYFWLELQKTKWLDKFKVK
jgi:hypothetical protein